MKCLLYITPLNQWLHRQLLNQNFFHCLLKKGEKIQKLKTIEVVSTAPEPIIDIFKRPIRDGSDRTEIEREGFPDMTPLGFVEMLRQEGIIFQSFDIVNRIEFKYVMEGE